MSVYNRQSPFFVFNFIWLYFNYFRVNIETKTIFRTKIITFGGLFSTFFPIDLSKGGLSKFSGKVKYFLCTQALFIVIINKNTIKIPPPLPKKRGNYT